MKYMKKALSVLLLLCLMSTYVIALDFESEEGIGTYIRSYQANIADGAQFNANTLEHVSAGRTEERYVKYTPGSQVVPIVAYGSVLYGKSTISRIANIVEEQGAEVVAGINGDFFFVDNGIPIGIVVTDGILRSSCAGQNAVGFFEDGSAIIDKPQLSVNLMTDTGYSLAIDYINIDRRNYGVYLLTPDFSSNTRTTTEGTTIILNQLSGDLRIGGTVTGTVSQVIKGSGPVNLEPGTMALTATEENNLAEKLEGVASSQKVTISVSSPDPIWNEVTYAVGAGDLIVNDGKVTPGLVKGGSPRTSIGITADGSVVLYTVDGRQSGYSNGMALSTLASRMISLGCVKAINLDGGGSTVMIAQYPGYSSTQVVNRPSEGTQRQGANYIFLINKAAPDDRPANLHIYPANPIVLSGSTVSFETKATDKGYYPTSVPIGIKYSVSNSLGSVDQEGKFTAGTGEGRVSVQASIGNISGETLVTVIETPTAINVINRNTGKSVQSLDINPEESIELDASASFMGLAVHADNNVFRWEVINTAGNIGTIENGKFTSSDTPGSRGIILVSAGELSVEIPVNIGAADQTVDSFEDPNNTGLTSGDSTISAAIESNKAYVRYGNASGRIAYDFSNIDGQKVTLPTRWSIPQNSRYLHFWVYGDGSDNMISFDAISKSGNALKLPVYALNYIGYRHYAVELPQDIAEISSVSIQRESETISGTIYIDQMVASYFLEPNAVGPIIEMAASDITPTNEHITIVAKVTENGLPVPKNRIRMTLDGKPINFNYSELSSELSVLLANINDGMLHRVTVTAWDSFGNISTASIDIEPHTAVQSIFADTAGHWSEKYAAYLNSQGVINGVIRDEGVYFYPTKKMTRAEFAVMLTNYLSLNTADYSHTELPYADIDEIPAWALDSVAAMYVNNVFLGKNNNGTLVFDPYAPITRAQVMTALGRTLPKGMGSAEIAFTDSKDIPDYATEYVGILVNAKVLTGYSDGTIRPNTDVQRSEAVKMLFGLY
ncbi:MAG: hypothetical protein GX257_02070 [Clostridiales bacterium]|nr:hypothetical protein [Clostridiales bacterium]